MTKNIPHPYSLRDAEAFLQRIEGSREKGESAPYAMVEISTGELVGSIGLRIESANQRAEMGYYTAVARWGCGFATEAGGALLELAFETPGLARMFAHHFPHNAASGRVLEKLGFVREGVLSRRALKWGKRYDIVLMGLLAGKRHARRGGG